MKKIFIALVVLIFSLLSYVTFNFTSNFNLDSSGSIATFSMPKEKEISLIPAFPTIVYHEFTENPNKTKSTVVTIDEFENHLKLLKENGYTSITDFDIYNYLYHGTSFPENPIHITFDDGYASNYLLAFDLLKKYEFKATIFPVTYAIDNPDYISDREILSWNQLKEMSDSGFISVQNHSNKLHHKTSSPGYEESIMVSKDFSDFENASKIHIFNDLEDASALIHKNLGSRVLSISYPFGSYSKVAIDAVKASGIRFAYTLNGELTDFSKQSQFELGRINIPSGISDKEFLSLLK